MPPSLGDTASWESSCAPALMLEDKGHIPLSCQSDLGESILRVGAWSHHSTQQSCMKAAAVRAVLLHCPPLRWVLKESKLRTSAQNQKSETGWFSSWRLSFACFAHGGHHCAYMCASHNKHVCSHVSSHALWILSCTKRNHCTINQAWHGRNSCLGSTSLYRLVLLYPREGADNPPAEFDSHKAANKGLSLADYFPHFRYTWHTFFIKLGKSRQCEVGKSKPVRKWIMSELYIWPGI